jgi:hypothetical protein
VQRAGSRFAAAGRIRAGLRAADQHNEPSGNDAEANDGCEQDLQHGNNLAGSAD